MLDLIRLNLLETVTGLRDKKFSETELNEAYLKRIQELNPKLNAFLTVENNSQGIPVGVKDIISTQNIKTTAGSKILSNYLPPFNATVVDKLMAQSCSIIGKTNCDEFAMGSSGENSAYGPTKNPWDITKVSGGTSSGSAVAVAADSCVFALGSDTGGSIRQPASFCGVVGLKPSYGRVSRYGLIAAVSSFDTIGPITKSVADAAQVLDWISGADGYDSNCQDEKFVLQPPRLQAKVKGLRVGIPREYFGAGLDSQVKMVIEKALKQLEDLGAQLVEVSLPHSEYALAAYYIINPSEVSANMARFDGIRFGSDREDFGPEVKRRIMLGTFALSTGYYDEYYKKAAVVRTLVKQDFDKAFKLCDVIVGPVSPTVAWNLGEKMGNPLKMYLADIYTIASNLAGMPGLSIPCGFVDGLPVGLQILGRYLDEETLLKVGYAYEQATDWHKQKADL